MTKTEFVLNQFKRTWNKKYENYCIERIIFKLDNSNLQFVTQQMFRRSNGHIALADLYFPQLKLTVEIDEKHHATQSEADKERTEEVLRQLEKLETVVPFEPEEKRIVVWDVKSFEEMNERIDKIVDEINEKIEKCGVLKWEVVMKTVNDYLKQGKIRDDEEAAFRTIQEVSELFNKGYHGTQHCYFSVGKSDNYYAWCPKLKLAGVNIKVPFTNEITSDGLTIYESADVHNEDFVNEYLNNLEKWNEIRYVFPRYQIATGEKCYVYRGVYKFDEKETRKQGRRVWKKDNKITILDTNEFFK